MMTLPMNHSGRKKTYQQNIHSQVLQLVVSLLFILLITWSGSEKVFCTVFWTLFTLNTSEIICMLCWDINCVFVWWFLVISGTSDESVSLSTPGMLVAQLSKSPSTEFTADSSITSEENKVYWLMQESFSSLSQEEKECIMNVPAAKNLDDLRMFARW